MERIRKIRPPRRRTLRQEDQRRAMFFRELRDARDKLQLAQNHLDQVTDPALIDCCIYRFNAAQLHYQVLLKQARNGLIRTGIL